MDFIILNEDTRSHHPFIDGFSIINQQFGSSPIIMETPKCWRVVFLIHRIHSLHEMGWNLECVEEFRQNSTVDFILTWWQQTWLQPSSVLRYSPRQSLRIVHRVFLKIVGYQDIHVSHPYKKIAHSKSSSVWVQGPKHFKNANMVFINPTASHKFNQHIRKIHHQ